MTYEPIDWQMLCLNLRSIKPLSQIAKEIGCEEQTLTRLARSDVTEPRFTIGIRLLNAHADYCNNTHQLWKSKCKK
jgi:hypothetical protein